MLKLSEKEISKILQAGELSPEDLAAKIAAENPAIEIARAYVNAVSDRSVSLPKITITEEQFKAYFKIKGIAADGSQERRGRKPKE